MLQNVQLHAVCVLLICCVNMCLMRALDAAGVLLDFLLVCLCVIVCFSMFSLVIVGLVH